MMETQICFTWWRGCRVAFNGDDNNNNVDDYDANDEEQRMMLMMEMKTNHG